MEKIDFSKLEKEVSLKFKDNRISMTLNNLSDKRRYIEVTLDDKMKYSQLIDDEKISAEELEQRVVNLISSKFEEFDRLKERFLKDEDRTLLYWADGGDIQTFDKPKKIEEVICKVTKPKPKKKA